VFLKRPGNSLMYWAATGILLAWTQLCPAAPRTDSGGQAGPAPARSSPATTAQKPSPSPFEKDLQHAALLMGTGKLDQAAQGFGAALEKAAQAGDVYAQAQAHRGLGAVFIKKGNYQAARAESEQSLSLFGSIDDARGQALLNDQLGSITQMTGDYVATREFFRQSVKLYDELGLLREKAVAMRNLAMAGDPDYELLTQGSLEIALQIGDKNLEAGALHLLGDNLFNKGELDAAEDRYNQAAAIYGVLADRWDMARVLTSEGRLQRAHGHPERALSFYQRALDLQEQVGDRAGVVQSLNAMGVAYQILNDNRKSAEQYERALSIAKELGSQLLIDFESGSLAQLYVNIGRDQEAIGVLESLLRQGIDPRTAAPRYIALSTAYFHLGRFQQSFEAAASGLEIARSQHNMDLVPGALLWKARIELKLGQQAAAEVDAEALLRTTEELRKHLVPSDFMKRGFSARAQDGFQFIIDLLTDTHQAGRALEVAEQARSRAFLDLLATRDLEVNAANRQQLAALRELHSDLRAQGVDPSDTRAGTSLSLVQRGGDSTAALWNQWLTSDPRLRSLVSAEPFSLGQVQAAARRLNSTVLSYWVSTDSTCVWLVGPGGAVHSARVQVSSKHLEQLISGLWPGGPRAKRGNESADQDKAETQDSPVGGVAEDGVAEDGVRVVPTRSGATITLDGGGGKNWRELYRLLIQPVERWLPSTPGSLLTIEPHGPLLILPFAALRNARGQYLIERYTLHFVPAVSLLGFTEAKKVRHEPSYLLVADPAGTPRGEGGKALPPLAGARREVATVARLLPPSEVKLLEGPQATERQVEELAGHSAVIHFATHGVIRDDQPFDSFLALGGSGWNLRQDGRFSAQKIYGLDLHADLVFMSACRSGLGQVSGDGMAGLTRAFLSKRLKSAGKTSSPRKT